MAEKKMEEITATSEGVASHPEYWDTVSIIYYNIACVVMH